MPEYFLSWNALTGCWTTYTAAHVPYEGYEILPSVAHPNLEAALHELRKMENVPEDA